MLTASFSRLRVGLLALLLAAVPLQFSDLVLQAQTPPAPVADTIVVPPLPAPPAPPTPPAPPVDETKVIPSPPLVLTPVDNVPIDSAFSKVATKPGKKIRISVQGTDVAGKKANWKIYPPNPDATLEEDSLTASFVSEGVGRYWLVAAVTGTDPTAPPLMQTVLIEVGKVPDVDPIPTPDVDPVPPDPKPDVDPAPVPVAGNRVLMVYDTVEGLPPVFASTEIRGLLNSYCVKGEDNKTPDWRCWGTEVDPEGDFSVWKDYRGVVPEGKKYWVVLGNGKTGYSGPPPNTIAEFAALIKKHLAK